MRQRRRCLALAVVLGCAAAPSAAQNLLQNGTFDTAVAPWEGLESPPAFSTVDSWGFPSSGSMRGSAENVQVNSFHSECIEVTGGTAYVRDFAYRLESTVGADPFVHGQIDWFSDSSCVNALDSTGGSAKTEDDGFWHRSHDGAAQHTAPLGALGARLVLVVAKFGAPGAPGTAVAHFDLVVFKVAGTCAPLSDVLCLNRERFQVEAFWRTATNVGRAAVVELTDDTGYLWFFSPSNVEVVIKVLDACAPFGKYWVFAGGLTDVEVEITVTDTQTGEQKTYTNPLGVAFEPVQDTGAFATCP